MNECMCTDLMQSMNAYVPMLDIRTALLMPIMEVAGAHLAEELLLQLQAPSLVGGCVRCQMTNIRTLQHHLQSAAMLSAVFKVDASLWLSSRLTCHLEVWYDR